MPVNYAIFAISVLCLSLASVFNRLAAAPPELIGSFRLTGATIILAVILYFKKQNFTHLFKNLLVRGSSEQNSLFCGFVFCIHLWTYSFAAQNTSIAACMIIFASNPLFTALGNFIFFKEPMKKRLYIAYALAFVSIFLLINGSLHSGTETNFYGNLSALLAAVLYSAYILIGKSSRKTLHNTQFTFLAYAAGAVGFVSIAAATGTLTMDLQPNTILGIAGLIVFSTFLGHATFTYLLKFIDINVMSCGKLSEPIFASIAAILIFQETPTLMAVSSYALTAIAMGILFVPEIKKQYLDRKKPAAY